MRRLLVVKECMSGIVTTASHSTAYQANPQIGVGPADTTFIQSCLLAGNGASSAEAILCIPTDRATAALPLLQARAMEDVLA